MGNTNEKVNISGEDVAKKDTEGAKLKEKNGEITKENKGNKVDEKEKIKVSEDKGRLKRGGKDGEEKSKKQMEKMDPINDNIPKKQEKDNGDSIVKFEIPLKDKLSLKRRCKLNIPPCSRVPEPVYSIKLLINDKYDGPFQLEMKTNPCEIHITGFEGVLLKRIKKRDIIFLQTIKNESLRMFIKTSEDYETNHLANEDQLDDTNMYTSQYLGEVMQIICKFLNKQDCESFEFFFPFIYGLIVHSDKVKIPVADFIDFGEYVIGSSKHILKRLDEYKNLNDKIYEDNMSIDEDNEENLLDFYEVKMIAQEREFFSRKNLELIYKSNSFFGLEISNSSNTNIEDKEEEDKIMNERQEKYSKFFPVSITGEAESGGIITFKDISSIGLKYVPEVIEWRISKNIGGSKAEYQEVPISVSKSFQINVDHVSL
ncbi:MSP-domain like family member [Cryptosporidium sp. chipmunk genotype I]|uniref:MSP-domain like family member n=1 Tax=Cryptosporidium sp. chipmunk genotype I TaxID=1280935 RepID=UPI00351A43F8|nr:MSP-domain like family member [Cryptosporidium sp. chipmunk genotype I]